ncbi:cbb3-type cytochrome c oxidase N-terminal domain-containing protein [Neptunitalea lumnitzerae]|uniref:Cytochrome c oxidase subunit III n=1 Tax=Neptunitalea lumnitzerae TaxID=2965509 RepID=A0ABQ5MHN0_9FLAO|nr:cbb3-type cytochrome c oxidase N-terminal domain-containing protein [Neptunitalea sp. Y10]GLB48902.1 cytochrome c oxidase subunit III [Neptunitalea sp. Y10]
MRSFTSYLRVVIIVGLVAGAAEYFIDSGDKPAFLTYPEVPIFLALFTIALIGIEVMIGTMHALTDAIMTDERKAAMAEQKAIAKENAWYNKLYKKLLDQKPIEEEGEIILEHDYDGIKELDNNLPPWWLYGFYLTIIIGVVYLVRFHVLGADLQAAAYEKEMAQAELDIAEYMKTAKDLVDAESATYLTEAADLSAGQRIFAENCVACHAADGGGGIGPNLTDKYWIFGGGIKNVFHTISEGSPRNQTMAAWKNALKPSEVQQVASYVLSLQGSTPASPKEPMGEIIWTGADDAATADGAEADVPATEAAEAPAEEVTPAE